MDLYESELKIRKKIDEKIKDHRIIDAAMKELETDNEKKKFKRGKKINDLRNETNKEVILDSQRETIVSFLVYKYNLKSKA